MEHCKKNGITRHASWLANQEIYTKKRKGAHDNNDTWLTTLTNYLHGEKTASTKVTQKHGQSAISLQVLETWGTKASCAGNMMIFLKDSAKSPFH